MPFEHRGEIYKLTQYGHAAKLRALLAAAGKKSYDLYSPVRMIAEEMKVSRGLGLGTDDK